MQGSRDQHSFANVLMSFLIAAGAIAAAGCKGKEKEQEAAAPSPTSATAPAVTPTDTSAQQLPPAVPPPAVTQASWSPDALEELLAPIALYPDQLLTQILAASVNSQEVLDGGNWLLQNQDLKGDQLDAAAQKVGFGAPMRALLQVPTVVDMMCQQMDWTRQLGSAFTSDQKAVLDAVQRLRAQAAQVGNLKSTPQQTVETKTEDNKTIVEVKPADPQVIYVPQYNPQVVYTTPPPQPASTPAPTTSSEDTVSTGTAVAAGLLAFGVGVMVGNAFSHDDYCYPNWGHSTVFVGARPFYPPAYAYRPAYGPAFRPAYGYAPPAGYRYNYNRNVVINNNNYYNRFTNNQNLRTGTVNSPLASQRQVAATNRPDAWRGQSTYAGTHKTATAERNVAHTERNVANAQRNTANTQRNVANAERNAANSQRKVADAQRNTANAQANRASGQRAVEQTQRSTNADRGFDDSNRVASASRSSDTTGPRASRENALAGADSHGGAFERAASARGQASTGGRGAAAGRRHGD